MVDVLFKGGRRLIGRLVSSDEDSITLEYTAREKAEGSKKKVDVVREEGFSREGINSVTPWIDFK